MPALSSECNKIQAKYTALPYIVSKSMHALWEAWDHELGSILGSDP
jgi:hypothetical protein